MPRRRRADARSSRGAPTPARALPLGTAVPDPESFPTRTTRPPPARALEYMGLQAGHAAARRRTSTPSSSARAPTAASRTCGPRPRSSRAARSPRACACSSCPARPGCGSRPRARACDEVFTAAGAEWRLPGCSMCLGMNPDQLAPGERSASTSNRNFEGRQGKGGRTHLVSPLVAAATAVRGTLSSPADLEPVSEGSA